MRDRDGNDHVRSVGALRAFGVMFGELLGAQNVHLMSLILGYGTGRDFSFEELFPDWESATASPFYGSLCCGL